MWKISIETTLYIPQHGIRAPQLKREYDPFFLLVFFSKSTKSTSLPHQNTTCCSQYHSPNQWEINPLHLSTMACPIRSSSYWVRPTGLCHWPFGVSIIKWHFPICLKNNPLDSVGQVDSKCHPRLNLHHHHSSHRHHQNITRGMEKIKSYVC